MIGFAVVASEVKSLANQTTKATEEVTGQIRGIQGGSQTAVGAIREICQIIDRISEINASISGAVEEQSAATQEVSSNINGVTQAASESSQSSTNVLGVAQSLAKQADALGARVDQFLVSVRGM